MQHSSSWTFIACVAGGIVGAREINFWRRRREENGEGGFEIAGGSFASEHKICNTFALKRLVYLRNLVSIPHESSAITGDVYNSIEGWLNLTCFKLSQRLAGKRRE